MNSPKSVHPVLSQLTSLTVALALMSVLLLITLQVLQPSQTPLPLKNTKSTTASLPLINSAPRGDSAAPAKVVTPSRAPLWDSKNSMALRSAPLLAHDGGSVQELQRALQRGVEALEKLKSTSPNRTLPCGPLVCTAELLEKTLLDFSGAVEQYGFGKELDRYLAKHFNIIDSVADPVRVTGYFQSALQGSRTPNERFSYPLYALPSDLVRIDLKAFNTSSTDSLPDTLVGRIEGRSIVPYYSRNDIDQKKALDGKGLELMWVDDPLAAFFLHIQGSGVVTLDDGSSVQVGYVGKNGHPYRAIGGLLYREGHLSLKEMSMQTILEFLRNHPEEQRRILDYNPSYIFFTEHPSGPIGAAGVSLVPERTIATDLELFPIGGLAFLNTSTPATDTANSDETAYQRFVVNLDTGGAIRGPARVDLFTGHGEHAEQLAGPLNSAGQLSFLVLKPGAGLFWNSATD